MNNTFLLVLCVLICSVLSAQTINFKQLPDSVRKEYKKTFRKWKRVTHFRKGQKEIAHELLTTRYLQIKEIEQKLSPDKKMIYKESRSVNNKFFDNMKDMMTAYQWAMFEKYLLKYQDKRKRKLNVEVLGYYDFWRY